MRKEIKLFAAIVLVVLAFAGIYHLYGKLSENYAPGIMPEVTVPEASSTEPSEEASDDFSEETSPSEPKDYAAPDFTVIAADGSEVTLSQYLGKPIVLNFWASWCPPCKAEMPHFEEAFKAYPDIQFMMINVTTGDDRGAAEEFIADSGFTFPVFYDEEGTASYIYGTGSLPVTFFIDSDGNLVTYAVGSLSAENLETGIGYIRDTF